VRVTVEVPEKLTKKQRELLEQFATLAGEDAHPQSKSFFAKVRELFGAEEPEEEATGLDRPGPHAYPRPSAARITPGNRVTSAGAPA